MRFLIWVSLMTAAVSCGPKVLEEADLMEFIKDGDNGLMKAVKQDDFEITLTYKPTDVIVKQQMENSSQRDSLRDVYSQYIYFTLTITKYGKDLESIFAHDLGTFASKIEYLTSQFSQNITLRTSSATSSVEDYLYVRSFGSGPSNFLVVFKKPEKDRFKIIVNGVHLSFGQTEFSFNQSDLENVPHLKL